MRFSSVLIAAAGTLLACGGQHKAVPEPASAPPLGQPTSEVAATPTPPSQAIVWRDDLPRDQKIAIMKERVMPRMAKVFQAADPKRYANFGCKTCHGSPFKDPQHHLPRLTLKNGELTAFETDPEIAKFMAEKVEPEMAAALGLQPYDVKTHQGFGCEGCHGTRGK